LTKLVWRTLLKAWERIEIVDEPYLQFFCKGLDYSASLLVS